MTNFSQFHDGSFDGLWTDGTTTHVFLSTEKKERHVAVIKGVVALNAGALMTGNIVFEIAVRDHSEITLQDLGMVYDLKDGSQGEAQAARVLERVLRESLVLLEITPTYGGYCVVLASSIELMARQDWIDHYLR
jgi:hypothetical protein